MKRSIKGGGGRKISVENAQSAILATGGEVQIYYLEGRFRFHLKLALWLCDFQFAP